MSSNLNYMGNEGFQLMGAAFEVHNEQGGGLRITRKAVGYLINLAPFEKVEWKRFILSQYIPGSD